MKKGYIHSLQGFGSLGKLSDKYSKKISENKSILERLINDQDKTLKGLGNIVAEKSKQNKQKTLLSFDEVISLYNKHISIDEIKAWVWYQRSMGIPMKGWEKYFLKGTTVSSDIVMTTKNAEILANNYEVLNTIESGVVLGKYLKTQDAALRGKYYIFRNAEGIRLVHESVSKIVKSGSSASEQELTNLVKAGALFYQKGELIPYPVFSYGNMYDAQLQLDKDESEIISRYGKDIFENHKKVIKDAMPERLTITSPDATMRPIITAISDFAMDKTMFHIKTVREEFLELEKTDQFEKVNGEIKRKTAKKRININFDGNSEYSLIEVFCAWLYTLNTDTDFKRSSAIDIVEYYIKGKPLRDDKLSPADKTELKANARNEGEELFAIFLNQVLTFEDQQKLDYTWNRIYNGWSDISYNKVPIGFECSSIFKSGLLRFSDAQREGVAFQVVQGSGINAYDVGVGKTMTAIATIANVLYSEKAKRVLIVVPKPTYDKWIMEIVGGEKVNKETGKKEFVYGVLTGTNIKLNDWYNLGKDYLKGINIKNKVSENSITILTYEGFKRLGLSNKVSDELIVELANILGQSNNKSARDNEIDYSKYDEMIGRGQKDTVADLDVLGFDYIIIDEAHRCKNVFSNVKADEDQGKKRYLMQGAQSDTGVKAFFHCNYIQRKHGKNIMLLTATPFTNSPLEIYSMLSLVAYNSLVKQGLYNIDTFFDMFVLPTTEWTANYKEQIVEKEVIKSFVNRNILSRLIYNHILYKTGEEAGVRMPCKINLPMLYRRKSGKSEKLGHDKQILTYLNMTPKMRENQNRIVNALRLATEIPGQKPNKALLFKSLSLSLDNAISPFLVEGSPSDYKEFIDESPKIKYVIECIKSVKQYHENKKESVSGQVIYMNRGKEFFPYIKEYLINEVGYKKNVSFDKMLFDEVEYLTSEVSDTKKENIKEAFLEGVVKIIIGTATIREGIDLQKNGTVIYDCYPEWNPTDVKQLEGRIYRQGNKFGYVRFVMPLVSDSMDVFVFQKYEEKSARINDIWFKGNRGNVLDLESIDPSEIKLALITDIDMLVKMFFDQELEEKEREFKRHRYNIDLISKISSDIQDYKEYREYNIKHLLNTVYPQFKNSQYFTLPDKFTKEQIKRAKDMLTDIEKFIASSERDDLTLFSLFRRIVANNYGHEHYTMSYFKEYTSKVKKAERNILTPKGFTINSDLNVVMAKYKADFAAWLRNSVIYVGIDKEKLNDIVNQPDDDIIANQRYWTAELVKKTDYKNSVRWLELRSEIKTKKSALAITGKSPKERANDFASLNHLLSYKMEDIDHTSCEIPGFDSDKFKSREPKKLPMSELEKRDTSSDKDKRIRIAKAKIAIAMAKNKRV